MTRIVLATEVEPGRFTATVDTDTKVVWLPLTPQVSESATITVVAADDGEMPEAPVQIMGMAPSVRRVTFGVQSVVHHVHHVTVELMEMGYP